MNPLLPPTLPEREAARKAAVALRLAIADPDTMGQQSTLHFDYSRPRRAEWITTWANLPGFKRIDGAYQHDCLPGWQYQRREILPELIPDLEALAERGERPRSHQPRNGTTIMAMTYRPAVRQGEKLLIGLAGPSGSGKTYSALELATGIQEVDPGEIFCIDTENRRAAMYAGKFNFMHGELHAPFTPEAYLSAIEEAVKQGAKIIVIDSMTHEHEGEGGILEIHEELVDKRAGPGADFARREAVKMSCWIEPKRRHNKFVNRLLQINAHIILCFRAKDKIKMVKVEKNGRTKTEIVSAGWQPICADRLEYEMTTLLVLPPNAKGAPDLSAEATKLPEPIAPLVKDGWQISRGLGVALAKWARGDNREEPAPRSKPNTNQASRDQTSQAGASDDEASQLPPRDGASDSGASSSPPPGGGASSIHRYHRVLTGAKDRDDLAARHDGDDDFPSFDHHDKMIARQIYKLHLRRLDGLDREIFEEELDLLLEGEPA